MTTLITATEKLACVERELTFRRYVYPRRVAAGKMTQANADREIAIMEEIANDLRPLAAKERLL